MCERACQANAGGTVSSLSSLWTGREVTHVCASELVRQTRGAQSPRCPPPVPARCGTWGPPCGRGAPARRCARATTRCPPPAAHRQRASEVRPGRNARLQALHFRLTRVLGFTQFFRVLGFNPEWMANTNT
eukprot:2111323-Pyramimonas_sp.AAC.2